MTLTPKSLAARYGQMSETELGELARSYDGLLEIAQAALRAEFARRGLEPPLMEEPDEPEFRRVVTVRLSIPVPPGESAWYCEACGARWVDDGKDESAAQSR